LQVALDARVGASDIIVIALTQVTGNLSNAIIICAIASVFVGGSVSLFCFKRNVVAA